MTLERLQGSLERLRGWYSSSPGVQNLRKVLLENDYEDPTFEPRTPYQINMYEVWRMSVLVLGGGGGLIAAVQGYMLGKEQFKQVSELSIYSSRYEAARTQQFYHNIGAMGYGVPVALRCSLAATFFFGMPGLFGVFYNDTDYLSSFVMSGGVCGVVMSMLLRKEFRTFSQKLLLVAGGCLFSLPYGGYCLLLQKYHFYPHYEQYKHKWKKIDPLWTDYWERHHPQDHSD